MVWTSLLYGTRCRNCRYGQPSSSVSHSSSVSFPTNQSRTVCHQSCVALRLLVIVISAMHCSRHRIGECCDRSGRHRWCWRWHQHVNIVMVSSLERATVTTSVSTTWRHVKQVKPFWCSLWLSVLLSLSHQQGQHISLNVDSSSNRWTTVSFITSRVSQRKSHRWWSKSSSTPIAKCGLFSARNPIESIGEGFYIFLKPVSRTKGFIHAFEIRKFNFPHLRICMLQPHAWAVQVSSF